MLISTVCSKCDVDFKDVVNEDQNCLDSCPELCETCKLFVETVHDPDTKLTDHFELPHQSLFFHLNTGIEVTDESGDVQYNQPDVSKYADKNVLLIGPDTIDKRKRIKQLKSLGFKRFVCLNRVRNWAFDLSDDWIYAEHQNVSERELTLKAVLDYQDRHQMKFDSVFTYDCFFVLMTSYLTDQLKLPGIPHELVRTLKYKCLFRQRCSELGITSPGFFLIHAGQRRVFIEQLGSSDMECLFVGSQDTRCLLPVILKNNYGCGKDFIRKCRTVREVIDAVEESLDLEMDILVEEFVSGNEIDIDILIQDNEVKFMAITDNFPPKEPYFFEQGCITPSVKLCETEKAEIKSLIKKWTKLLQFQNGCLHFEAICINDVSDLLSEGKFLVPVEINPRMGGSETWSKIKAAYDVDLLREHMNISLGIQLQLDENFQNARNQCISWDFREEFPIFIESIRIDLPQVLRSRDIVEVAIIRSPGQSLNRDIYGWLTVKANLESSEVELKAKLDRVLSLFEFNTKKICG